MNAHRQTRVLALAARQQTRVLAVMLLACALLACGPRPAQTGSQPAANQPAGGGAPAASQVDVKAVEDFYRGKTVRLLVGFSAGGGYDSVARLLARHLPRHIPGAPNVVVENMPGASGL